MEVFDICALAGPMLGLPVATQKIWSVLGPYLAKAHTIRMWGIRRQEEHGLGWDETEAKLRSRFQSERRDWPGQE
jgi:hypothetical protein